MDDAFHPTPSRRQANTTPDPEMVESGSKRGRRVDGDDDRDTPRGSSFTTARQRVPTSRFRSMDRSMAGKGGEGQSDGHSLRGRSGTGVRAPRRGRAVPEGVWGTAGEVRAGTTSGEDAADRVRTKRRTGARGARRREARELHVSGVYA